MIELIETEDFHDTIEACFRGDRHMYMTYHYESPTNHEESSAFSAAYVQDMHFRGAQFYAIVHKNGIVSEMVGYACVLTNCIWDYYVRPGFDGRDEAWSAISSVMPDEFHIRLYDGNYRDINWLIQSKGAKPFTIDKRMFGYYSGMPEKYIKTREPQAFCRELSQIILNFTKN